MTPLEFLQNELTTNHIMSCKRLARKWNKQNPSNTHSSKYIYSLLKRNRSIFDRADPINVGSSKWFDRKYYLSKNCVPSNKLRRVSNLWTLNKETI